MSNKSLPQAKRMNRKARIQSARMWLQKYNGKNIASGYRKHFNVDLACAFKELEMLGIKLDPEYMKKVLKSVEDKTVAQQHKKILQKRSSELEQVAIEQDKNFAYIADYTSAGFSYSITWDVWNGVKGQNTETGESFPFF